MEIDARILIILKTLAKGELAPNGGDDDHCYCLFCGGGEYLQPEHEAIHSVDCPVQLLCEIGLPAKLYHLHCEVYTPPPYFAQGWRATDVFELVQSQSEIDLDAHLQRIRTYENATDIRNVTLTYVCDLTS